MTDAPDSGVLNINVKDTLRFFDEKPVWAGKNVTAIVGMIGEDLNAACFRHYMESKGAKVTVLQDTVGTGGSKGPRLDRWIIVDWDWPDGRSRTVFQTEIKNWSAFAIGGEKLSVQASRKEVAKYKKGRWESKWDPKHGTLRTKDIAKVLVPMKPPSYLEQERENLRPLLIFWEAVGPSRPANNHLFCKPGPTYNFPFTPPSTWPELGPCEFPELWVFSVSSYLRSLPDATIELQMPNAADRLGILDRLFFTTPAT